jgi:Protein of unknown function (DUF3037)
MGGATMLEQQKCNFFLLRYVPDAVKNEFVNVGLVLLPPAGEAQLRFTRDWSRVKCLDPQADLELLEAMENDLREKLRAMNGDRDFILRKIQDSFSNAVQTSEFKACAAASPAAEADELARLYLERRRPRHSREAGGRQAILAAMRQEFESAGVWRAMRKEIRVADYTRRGDPLKIDCGYSSNGTVKLFHALGMTGDANAAKVLAFSFPALAEGLRKKEGKQAQLTAVVEDNLPRDEEQIAFSIETLSQQGINVAPLARIASLAAVAAREMGMG